MTTTARVFCQAGKISSAMRLKPFRVSGSLKPQSWHSASHECAPTASNVSSSPMYSAMAVCAIVLLLAERIQRVLGERFIIAVERLMGLILVAVAVEMLLRGFKEFAAPLARG